MKFCSMIYRGLFVCFLSILSFAQVAMAAPQEDAMAAEQQDTVNRDAEDFVRAYVMVADPGSTLYAVYGHTCLRLVCDTYNMDYCFSYESEQWDTQPLALLAGKLKMGMMAIPFEDYLATYAAEGRIVRQYELMLPIAVKRELWRTLDEAHMEGMNLPFDLVKYGCTSTCVVFLHKALGGIPIDYAPWEDEMKGCIRTISYNRLQHGWAAFWMMTVCGGEISYSKAYSKEAKLVIPALLVEVWQKATIQGKSFLSTEAEIMQPISRPQESPFTPLIASLCVLALAIISVFWRRNYIDWFILVLYTLLAIVITCCVFFSPLSTTGWNFIIFPFNLLPVIFWKWRDKWAVGYTIFLVLFLLILDICSSVIWLMPAHVIFMLAFCIVTLKKNIRERRLI